MIAAVLLTTVALGAPQPGAPDAFGDRLAAGEDLDLDRIPDLVVSAHAEGNSQSLKLIALSGKDGHALWHVGGMSAGCEIRALGFLPDQDGDHVAEVAAVLGTHPGNWRLQVCSGRTGKLLASHRPALAELLAVPLCDVDGDGRPEWISTAGGSLVRIHSWMDSTIDRALTLPEEVGAHGVVASAALLSDLDGDGVREIACGLPFAGKQSMVFALSGKDGRVLVRAEGEKPDFTSRDWLGGEVASIGDFDGDGIADILATNNGAGLGSYGGVLYARVLSGKTGGTLFTHEAGHGRVLFATCPDLVVGDTGESKYGPSFFVVSGKTRAVRPLLPPGALEGRIANSIQAPADFDGDGVRDALVVLRGESQGLGSVRAYSMKDGRMLREFFQPVE